VAQHVTSDALIAVRYERFTRCDVARRLRYSERKRLSETGSLGDLTAEPSGTLRRATTHALDRATRALYFALRDEFVGALQDTREEHFGWAQQAALRFPEEVLDTDQFLDFIEIVVEQGARQFRFEDSNYYVRSAQPWPDAER
jgi:hypothetical protein